MSGRWSWLVFRGVSRWQRSVSLTSLNHSANVRVFTASISHARESAHTARADNDNLDLHIEHLARSLCGQAHTSIHDLYQQYQNEAGIVIDKVVPYEERPPAARRAHVLHKAANTTQEQEGDGLVLVVHAQLDLSRSILSRTTVCSGFVVNASLDNQQQGDIIVTCAHTLEEIYRHLRCDSPSDSRAKWSFSFLIPSSGQLRIVTKLLASMPRSDVIVLEAQPAATARRLRPLPLSPFPVYTGTPVLTHLFGSPDPPTIKHSMARTKITLRRDEPVEVEQPIAWLGGHAWRRWGSGVMLGYRSYTGLELEAGISSVLPHILTSILPTSGSSGGPLVNGDNGCVVGMTSGRRMDNRVEGERGWGCSSEGIFEMFSLPGFMPSTKSSSR